MKAYFRVTNFDDLQHYRDRSPPWIKLYNKLLDDYEFAGLPDSAKAHLVQIWLLASRLDNKIPSDAKWIGQKINATEPVNLDTLICAGFLTPYEADANEDAKEQWASRYVSDKVRASILERDNYKCTACGSESDLEIDHIVPISQGGDGGEDNLQTLCRSCNRRKRTRTKRYAEQSATQKNKRRSLETERETETEEERTLTGSPPNKDARQALSDWNTMADRAGLPTAQRLTKTRRAKLNARLKECGGLAGWADALARVEASSFLTGDNPRGWRADLDFMLQESSFTKLIEGRYDDREPNTSARKQRAEQDADAEIAAALAESDRRRNDQQPPGNQRSIDAPECDIRSAAPEDGKRPGEPEIHGNAASLPGGPATLPAVGVGGGNQAGAGEPRLREVAQAGGAAEVVPGGAAGGAATGKAREGAAETGARPGEPGGAATQRLPHGGAEAVHGDTAERRDVASDAGGLQGAGSQTAGGWRMPEIPEFLDRRRTRRA